MGVTSRRGAYAPPERRRMKTIKSKNVDGAKERQRESRERETSGCSNRRYIFAEEKDSPDHLRSPCGKTIEKICPDWIHAGVTYLSCEASNIVHPRYT